MISRGFEQLLGRASGPLHLRLVIMPTVVTILAIRAGLRDARVGEPAFLWGIISDASQRRQRMLAAWRDVTRIFIVALVLDTVYQLMVLRAYYVVQALIVAVACAIVPYVLVRGPATRLARLLSGKKAAANISAGNSTESEEGTGGPRARYVDSNKELP